MGGGFGFGFGNSDRDTSGGAGDSGSPGDPFGGMNVFGELQKLLSWTGGPVNWDLARQLAGQALAAANPDVTDGDRAAVADALHLADLWLDEVTDLPSGISSVHSWTRGQWLERTMPVWQSLCDPVAERVVAAMGSILPGGSDGSGEGTGDDSSTATEGDGAGGPMDQLQMLGAMLPPGGLAGVMSQVGGLMFGAQVGQGLGGLAQEVVSATDVGIPLGPQGIAALVPANVVAFGDGLERPTDEVRLYLALREAAHQRLFAHVPWLRQRLLDTVTAYAQGITVDMSAMDRAMGDVDPMNPESVQAALAGGLFEPQTTEQQKAALRRLETLLALVEGWVDAVVAAAATDRMPGAEALREASRRRRATGGPAEQTFATLVGLELRPRRLREAAALWWGVTERHGVSGRDGLWGHPDLLPSADDLDDPLGFAESMVVAGDDLAELDALETAAGSPVDSSAGAATPGETAAEPDDERHSNGQVPGPAGVDEPGPTD